MKNLLVNGVEYVLVTRWDTDQWPPQHPVLVNSPRSQILFDDGYSVVLKIQQDAQ